MSDWVQMVAGMVYASGVIPWTTSICHTDWCTPSHVYDQVHPVADPWGGDRGDRPLNLSTAIFPTRFATFVANSSFCLSAETILKLLKPAILQKQAIIAGDCAPITSNGSAASNQTAYFSERGRNSRVLQQTPK